MKAQSSTHEQCLSKIVFKLLLMMLISFASCQKRSSCPHYMPEQVWKEKYQNMLKKDESTNQKKRKQAALRK
ncbi:MAG: hypothetical protein RMJ87_10150 [Cytophagales bacterium]|nr:hypothetical protein [Bernardetiaceae bacterium]MDW8205380.1 hypothetical protein [Cytophagales bacterium]